MFSVFITLQLSGSVIYRGLKEFSDGKKFISAATGLMLTSSLASALVYFLLFPLFKKITGLSLLLSALLFFEAFLNGIRALRLSEAKFFYRYKICVFESAFFALITPILSILFIKLGYAGALSRIYAHIIVSLLFAASILFFVIKSSHFYLFSAPVWRFLIKYALPSLPHFLSISLIFQIGKISVGRFFGESDAALLSISTSVGFLPSLFTQGALSALLPWVNRKLAEDGGKEKIYTLTLSLILPLTLLVLLFLCFCPEAMLVIAPKSYSPALAAIYPIAAATVFTFLINLFSSMISYYKKTYFVTLGSVFGAFIALILNFTLTARLGFVFAAFAELFATISILIIYSIILKKRFKHQALPASKLALYSLLLIVGATALFYLSHSLPARLIFSIAIILSLIPSIKRAAAFIK